MNKDRLVHFTQDIVRIPSLSGQEAAVSQRIVDEMTALNFDQIRTDETGNVIGVIEGETAGPTLLFDAHTDTVGISPGVPWETDPYAAELRDEAICGRGAADMKGALAAMVYAAADVDRRRLHGRVIVSASVLEEVLEGVALERVMRQMPPDFVVIGEATDLNLARGGRGRAEVHLQTVGIPSHSSAPELGRNAVLDMMRVIAAVEQIELPEHPLMGPAILALTDIISEPYPGHSVIPSVCKVTYDRRLLPGETQEDVLQAITGRPELADITLHAHIATGSYVSYTGQTITHEKFFPAWLLSEDDPFVQTALAGLTRAGLAPQLQAYRFCTNAAYSAGVAHVPTVGFGPATEADAHVINERLKLADLFAAARGYKGIIQEVCRAA
jgi:putative selenium metabolism hydrolase